MKQKLLTLFTLLLLVCSGAWAEDFTISPLNGSYLSPGNIVKVTYTGDLKTSSTQIQTTAKSKSGSFTITATAPNTYIKSVTFTDENNGSNKEAIIEKTSGNGSLTKSSGKYTYTGEDGDGDLTISVEATSSGAAKIGSVSIVVSNGTANNIVTMSNFSKSDNVITAGNIKCNGDDVSAPITIESSAWTINTSNINAPSSNDTKTITITATSGKVLKYIAFLDSDCRLALAETSSTGGTVDGASWTSSSTPTTSVTFKNGISTSLTITKIFVITEAPIPTLTGAWKIGDDVVTEANVVQGTSFTLPTFKVGATSGTPESSNYNVVYSVKAGSTGGILSVTENVPSIDTNTAGEATLVATLTTTDDSKFLTPTTNTFEYTVTVSAATAPTINVTGAGNVARGSDLMLEATVTAVPDITYIKWYACDSEGTISGNPLGEDLTYAPSTSTVGTYYYRAVVNNGIGGDASHDVYSNVQTINVLPQAPTFLPVAGAVFAGSTVELSSADNAEIYYTTNEDEPTVDPANLYSAPITVDAAMTIKAIAVKSGLNSATASAAYTIKDVATPVISKKGIVASGTKVTITSTDGNAATIYYTLDGSDPRTSGTKQTYSAPVSITSSCTLNAVAKVNSTFSNSASAVFTVSNATQYTYEYGPTKTFPFGTSFTVPVAENPTTVVITYNNSDGEWNDKNDATPAYFQGKSNPTLTDGIPTAGSYITLTPSQDGTITFMGYSSAAKPFYVKKNDGTQLINSSTPSTPGLYEFSFDADKDVVYYVYLTGSKVMFHGLTFTTKFTAIDVKVGSTGWASYISDQNLDFGHATPEDLKAYAATYGAENITLTDVTEVPANKGIVLQGTANTTYTVPVLASTDAEVTTDLKGSATTDYAVNQNDYKYYVLANVGGEQGFYQYTGTAAIPAGKAFFEETAGGAKFLSLTFAEEEEGETTGINAVETSIADGATLYNLAGQKVGKDYKGIVIVNGKKYVRK